MQACLSKYRLTAKDQSQNIQNLYTFPSKVFGNGKSGAVVFLSTLRDSSQIIIKFYLNAFVYSPDTDRPRREIYTTCALSRLRGYPTFIAAHKCKVPEKWFKKFKIELPAHPTGLALITRLMNGTPLNNLDQTLLNVNYENDKFRLDPTKSVAICLRILDLIRDAEKELGGRFVHHDLHPDNVFVDVEDTDTFRWNGFTVVSPRVGIIDFDLADTNFGFAVSTSVFRDAFHFTHPWSAVLLNFVKTSTGCSVGTLKTGCQDAVKIVVQATKISNKDVRYWFALANSLLWKYNIKVKSANSIKRCISTNHKVWKKYLVSTPEPQP
jgi:hypothetical protein